MTLRRLSSWFLVLGVSLECLWPAPATPQVETVAALLALADKLVNDLRNVLTTASVEGQRTIGTAITEINGLEAQLRNDVQNLETSITNLGSNVQNSANELL